MSEIEECKAFVKLLKSNNGIVSDYDISIIDEETGERWYEYVPRITKSLKDIMGIETLIEVSECYWPETDDIDRVIYVRYDPEKSADNYSRAYYS